MMERQPDKSSREKLDISGLSLATLEGYATRQLQQVQDIGALFAEMIPTPTEIKNPLPLPIPRAVIITRWVGSGVFGVVFPDREGENLTGWISISHAIRANPGLTPSGAFSREPWDKNIFTTRDHLLPRPTTMRERAHTTGAEMAQQLLTRFPNRIDLSPSFDLEMMDQATILEIAAEHLRPLAKELFDGLMKFPLSKGEDAQVHRLIADIANSLIRKMVIEHALKTFTDERLRQARQDFESGDPTGVMRKLIDEGSKIAAMVMAPLARETLFKDPFAPPPTTEVRHRCGIGLSISMTQRREYSELWKHLEETERTRIVADISSKAWSEAVKSYATRN